MTTRRSFLKYATAAACAFAIPDARGQTTPAATMLTRKIPSSGEAIPAIELGTYQGLMTRDMKEETLAPLAELLKHFFDAGGRLVDTAPSYGNAEEVAGLLTRRLGINDKLFFATKVLEQGDESTGIGSYQRSMQRLKREKLELMQCHNFINWQTHLKTLRQWKENGKFRYIGVTHFQDHAHEELERIIKRDKVDFLQINYSIAEPNAAQRLLPAAKELGVAVLINRPFAGGQILAKMRDKPLPEFAKAFASSWAQAFLKFILANDAVTCVLPATSKPEHLADNVRAGFGPLPTPQQCAELARAVA